MKKKLLLLFFLSSFVLSYGQSLLKGVVCDANSKKPLSGIAVVLNTKQGFTDDLGKFEFSVDPQEYTLMIVADGYDTYIKVIQVATSDVLMDTINLVMKTELPSDAMAVAEVSMGSSDFESSKEGQNVSSLLHSSADVFNNIADFNLSSIRFRSRGYDSEYEEVYISGMRMNDAENGRPSWSEWGGLNDAMRNKQGVYGVESTPFAFGGVGGTTNINTRASGMRKQNKITYALSNRSYNNRITYSYGSGVLKNGWSFSVNASRRWSQEGMVEGTTYDAWAYFLGAEKKINSKHSIAFSVFGSPYKRGLQSSSVQEAYELTGNNLYNSNWGYQEGEKRNARIRKAHEPKFIINDYWKVNEKLSITNTLGASYSRYGTTSLNWFDALDPRPDYYRYLPSYQLDAYAKAALTDAWKNDPDKTLTQIDWAQLYNINYIANSVGSQAKYVLEERRDDHLRFMGSSVFKYQKTEELTFNGGLEYEYFIGNHFKTLNDLLGGEYIYDYDQFAERDFAGDSVKLINNLDDPNKKILVGDRYGYDYTMKSHTAKLWGMATLTRNNFDAWVSANLGFNSFYRQGNMQNGRYADNSLGKSEVSSFITYGIKVGGTWKISGRYYVQGNAGYLTRPPVMNNMFTSIRISNKMLDNVGIESNLSGDISFIFKGTRANAKVTAYQTYFKNQSELIGFYHDVYRTYTVMVLTGVDKVHQGFEIGGDYKISKSFTAVGALGLGNYRYTSRPTAYTSFENGSLPDTSSTVYSKYFYVSGTPQNVASIGLKYSNAKYWFIDLNANYYDNLYLDFNPARRTQTAIANLGYEDPMIETITKQEKLPAGFTLDASIGKSWRVKDYYIGINFNVSNILGTQLKSGGFEQMRFDYETKNLDKFPPKYFYGYGRTFFLMLSVRM